MSLTKEELRVKVAELCDPDVHYTQTEMGDWIQWTKEGNMIGFHSPPDYPNDLNACAEFEKILTDTEHQQFRNELAALTGWVGKPSDPDFNHPSHHRRYISATAAQRCRAFCRTKGVKDE